MLHLSKTNPTELNGKPLGAGAAVLAHNDELRFGERVFRIEYGTLPSSLFVSSLYFSFSMILIADLSNVVTAPNYTPKGVAAVADATKTAALAQADEAQTMDFSVLCKRPSIGVGRTTRTPLSPIQESSSRKSRPSLGNKPATPKQTTSDESVAAIAHTPAAAATAAAATGGTRPSSPSSVRVHRIGS